MPVNSGIGYVAAHDEETKVENDDCVISWEGGFESKIPEKYIALLYSDEQSIFTENQHPNLEVFDNDSLSDAVFYQEFIDWLATDLSNIDVQVKMIKGNHFEYYYCERDYFNSFNWLKYAEMHKSLS